MTRRVEVREARCSGCRVCQLTCSMVHQDGAANPRWAAIRLEIDRRPDLDSSLSRIDAPRACRQCEPAPCVQACPVEAFHRESEDGVWLVDGDRCTGCGACEEACPFDMIAFREGTAVKCDLCGGQPACVAYCPTGALALE